MDEPPTPREMRRVYDAYNDAVEASGFGRWMRFGNLGYAPVAGLVDEAEIAVSPRQPFAESARMVVEMLGSTPLAGRDLLDIGCGRGGSLAFLSHKTGLARIVGYDLCESSVFNGARLGVGRAQVLVADAQDVPFRDESFDVVLNVESALHYPRIESFFAEVRRVLRPDGVLCWSDLLHVDAAGPLLDLVRASGFAVTATRDITRNVAAALAARSRAGAFPGAVDGIDLERFSRVEEFAAGLSAGRYTYLLLRATPAEHGASAAEVAAARIALSEASLQLTEILPAAGIVPR